MSDGILIDTHIWLWHLNGDKTLSARIRKLIDESANDKSLYLSIISIWEVAMLVKKKRISFNTSCQIWVNRALAMPGISLISLTPEIAIESCELSGNFHGDPADRIITASAKVNNLRIISRDQKLGAYCLKHEIECIEG